MKIIQSTIFAALLLTCLSAQAIEPIINLSIGGEISPGVYGQVQFGNAPPPPVFYPEPRIVVAQQKSSRLEPIYLHVPPGHAKHWDKHCREYNACNRPVYFVKSAEYEPGYHEHKTRDHKDKGNRDENHGDEGHKDHGKGHRG